MMRLLMAGQSSVRVGRASVPAILKRAGTEACPTGTNFAYIAII